MQSSEQQLIQETQQYLDVIIEAFGNHDDDLETYAKYLSQYELSLIQPASPETKTINPPEWAKNAIELINIELKKKSVRSRICAGIQRLSGDTWDIAKAVVSSLVTLSLSGVVSFPQTPFFIALAAIMIARIGTSSLCEEKT